MKILLSKGSTTKIMLLMLLSLNAFAGMTILVNAPATKDPNVLITGSGSVELTWKSGKSGNISTSAYANLGGLYSITIIPTRGWHISAFLIDGVPQAGYDEDGLSLTDGLPKRAVSVTFEENGGIDDVDVGSGMPAYPTPEVYLIFLRVLEEGNAEAYTIGIKQPGQIGKSWDVYTNAGIEVGEGAVTVCLVVNLDAVPPGANPEDLRLWKTEVVLGDVNLDGIVTADDVSMIANVNPEAPADPAFDVNGDGVVDDIDVTVASHHLGEESVWEQLDPSWAVPDYDNGLVYVYGVTDDLSIFDCI